MPIVLKGGPLDLRLIPGDRFVDREAVVGIYFAPPRPNKSFAEIAAGPVEPLPVKTRLAVYRLVDDESAEARFFCWDDERPVSPFVQAMLKMSDEQLFAFLESASRARREP